MALTKKQCLIKLAAILPAAVLGLFSNYFLMRTLALNLVGSGPARSMIMLLGQILVFYSLFQIVIFRGQNWTHIEMLIILVVYTAVLLVGLIFRLPIRIDPRHFAYWFSLNQIELNPFSFISNFLVDRSSLLIGLINFMIFIPLPFLLHHNRLKPRFWVAFILFFAIELLQPMLAQGFFSLGDITLYSAGYLIGLTFLNKKNQRMEHLGKPANPDI